MAEAISARLTRAEGRWFGLVVGTAFVGISILLWWRQHPSGAVIAAVIGGFLWVGGLAFPRQLGPAHTAWMALASAMSKITTPIFMGIVYFGVVTPIGLLMSLLKRNPLARPRNQNSFWIARDAGAGRRGDMERQF